MSDARTHRVTFYLNDEEQSVLEQALSESGKERADYFRELLTSNSTNTADSTANGTANGTLDGYLETIQVLKEALADTRQSKDRLEKLLWQSQATVTKALPAAGGTSRPWWKFWAGAEQAATTQPIDAAPSPPQSSV